ncbi:uncharacterized protein LOC109504124 isoform X2 [Harpegnathos saltator]|nr:uncharacterized protein LOC109504124 isoform X2 [Harpegnathos saltator]
MDEMFELMPTLCGTIFCFGKLTGLTHNSKKFKDLIDLTHEDWINIPKGRERQILMRYAKIARKFTISYATCICGLLFSYLLLPLSVFVLDSATTQNETGPRKLLHRAEYFVDQEKYYYMLLSIEVTAYVVSGMIVIAIDAIYFLLLEHICGMQNVLCHCLENLTVRDKLRWVDNDQLNMINGVDRRVRHCIQLDKRIREYVDIVEATFATSILVDIGFGFMFHTSTCIMIVIRKGRLTELAQFVSLLILQSFRFFLISWTGQEVIDHSSIIPIAT